MEDNKDKVGGRTGFMGRFRELHPEGDWEDDEALFDRISADYDERDRALGTLSERERALMDVFATNPYAAGFLADMARGTDPWCGLIERIGLDGVSDLISDPSKREEFAESNAKFVKQVARERELKAEFESNMDESLRVMESMQNERGLSDEEIDSAADLLKGIANEVLIGKFSRENLELALKALNYDKALVTAAHEGEVRGRNTKVEAELRKPRTGDGVPHLGGANASARVSDDAPEDDIFAQAAMAQRGLRRF